MPCLPNPPKLSEWAGRWRRRCCSGWRAAYWAKPDASLGRELSGASEKETRDGPESPYIMPETRTRHVRYMVRHMTHHDVMGSCLVTAWKC